MAERKKVDWEKVEAEYRAGQFSVSEIGRRNGVSHTAINKKAKAEGWLRDLADKVRQAVSAKLVSDRVSNINVRETIEAASQRGADVILAHRADIARLRRIANALAERLERKVSGEEVEGYCLGDRESAGDLLEKLSRIDTRVVQLERQAFNLNEPAKLPATGAVDLSGFSDEALAQLESILSAEPGGGAGGDRAEES